MSGQLPNHMQVKTTGDSAEISQDDYRKVFNEKLSPIVELVASCNGNLKEAYAKLAERAVFIDKLILNTKIERHAVYATMQDLTERATDEERLKIKELDKMYKVKAPSGSGAEKARSTAPRAAGMTKQEKSIKTLIEMGFERAIVVKQMGEDGGLIYDRLIGDRLQLAR